MNNSATVDKMIAEWTAAGLTKSEIAVKTADACLGWSYVWGGYGQYCTPTNRNAYANRSTCPSGESREIVNKCRSLSGGGSCTGCKWFPGGSRTRFFDCRGFTRWVLQQVGVTIKGAGATSQYNDNSNWTEKGLIANMPEVVCCVFYDNNGTKEHTGLYIGNGQIIHCSGTVKQDTTANKRWTHYAVPKGMDGTPPAPEPEKKPTLRRGDRGAFVTLAQTELIQKGYSVGASGADGIFGLATENAVKNFQRDHVDETGKPLTVDGVIGQKTWWALDNAETTVFYTVNVPHLSLKDADALCAQYPGSTKTEERGLTLG